MSILCYHAVDPVWRSDLSVPPERFSDHCAWLARRRKVLPAAVAAGIVSGRGSLPAGISALTFDDGYASLYEHALPHLVRHGLVATIFLVAQTLAPDRLEATWAATPDGYLPSTLTLEQIQDMQEAGIAFGSHSLRHADLTEMGPEECERDLRASKEMLEDLLRGPVELLAYPRGLHDEQVRAAAQRAGYTYAFGTSKNRGASGRFGIPRIGIYPGNGIGVLAVKSSRWYPALRTGLGGRIRSG